MVRGAHPTKRFKELNSGEKIGDRDLSTTLFRVRGERSEGGGAG
jgi:hypothetical protein